MSKEKDEKREKQLSELEKLERSKAMIKELTISKRNDMIQNSRSNLTLREWKAVLYMMAKIKPEDDITTEYEFSCLEFAMAIGITGRSKYNYKQIMSMLQKLSDKSWWLIEKDDTKTASAKLVRWFNTVHLGAANKNDPGKIKIKFHEDMAPYIFNLAKQKKENGIFFTTFKYKPYILMKNKYSPRLLEILESYRRNNVEWYFDIRDLQELLADTDADGVTHLPKRWEAFSNFEKDVLRPAVNEINRYSDLCVNYTTQKRDIHGTMHRSAQRVIFFMAEKTIVEKIDTDQVIIEGMREHMDEKERARDREAHESDSLHYEQMKLEFEQTRQEKERISRHEQIERRVKTSKYPLLTALFPEFDDSQIQALFSSSILNYKERNSVDINSCEMWVCNYIQTYYDVVKSKNKGKDPYPLLLAYISQDYNKVADKITV